jgi:hypothetical protein
MAWAQNPQVLQNARTQLNTVQENSKAASNEALDITPTKSKAGNPTTAPAKSSATAAKSTVVAVVDHVTAKPSVTRQSRQRFRCRK